MPELNSRYSNNNIRKVVAPVTRQATVQDQLTKKRLVEEPRRLDSAIVIVIVLLLCYGMVMLFSASMSVSIRETSGALSYLMRQLMANLLGVIAIFLLSKFTLKVFDRPQIAVFLYLLSLLLLVATLFAPDINGARRWLTIPLFGRFQPSEFTKVVTVYAIACYESWLNKERATGRFPRQKGFRGALKAAWWDIIFPVVIVAIPMAVMVFQPHVSGVTIILIITAICIVAAGHPLRSWLVSLSVGAVIVAALAAVLISTWSILPPKLTGRFAHVGTRLNIFSAEESVSEDEYYQSRQANIAIGSGGLTGVGLGQGKQKNNYLPEGHNDYIYSNLVEETGFVGGMAVIVLFLLFFAFGLRVAFKASSVYSQIVAAGITSLIAIQALLNIAVNVGAIPPTGISLPFFSYGGTANMFFLIGVGLLLNVSKYGVKSGEENVLRENG